MYNHAPDGYECHFCRIVNGLDNELPANLPVAQGKHGIHQSLGARRMRSVALPRKVEGANDDARRVRFKPERVKLGLNHGPCLTGRTATLLGRCGRPVQSDWRFEKPAAW